MPDDQVTIDPEFSPPPPGDGQSRWLRVAGIVAVGVAAFILGWLLRSPSPAESEPDEVAVTSSTALTGETVVASTTTRPRSLATTTEPPWFAVPLGEAVPGFTDTITMAAWSGPGLDLMRWWPSRSAPETIVSFDQEAGRFAGLDASGRWVAQIAEAGLQAGLLSVRPVLGTVDEGWPDEFDQAIDVRVASAVWHDHDPGRLAWVKCSRSADDADPEPRRIATVYSYDVAATDPGEPVAEFTIDGGCVAGWGISPQLGSWGAEGVRYWVEGDEPGEFLIQPDGTKVGLQSNFEIVAAPDGSAVVIEHGRLGESYLLSSDGTTRSPVPGLAEDEWLDAALWSPDGSLLAYGPERGEDADPLIRIVEMDTGSVVAEVTTPHHESYPEAWSTDGRFLLLTQWPDESNLDGKLMFYDITTDTPVAVPLPPRVGAIDVTVSAPAPWQLTPVEWGIALDEVGPGTHMVSMIVDASPLLPDQVEDVSGKLIWDETVVDLCGIAIRESGGGVLPVGDIFGTDEGCGPNPFAMQDAFDEYGLPGTACVAARVDGVDHDYCAPLASGSPD